jgi:hypothetical protein
VVRDTVDWFDFELFDIDFEVTVRPLLFDQCGSFIPVCFVQRGQSLEVVEDFAEYVVLIDLEVFPDWQLSQM